MRAAAATAVLVPGRFNGALGSGQGGYSAGVFAGLVDGPVEVSLRRPVTVDVALTVARSPAGAQVLDGEEVVAEVHAAAELELACVPAVTLAEARAGRERYRGTGLALFERCYVCGRERPDAFGVLAGEVPGRAVVASPWTPPAWTADADGEVLREHVWAVMDCPTYFASIIGREPELSYLVRMRARVAAPVRAEVEHVVVAWPIAQEGRKRLAASAVLSASGEVLATAEALLVTPRG